jgi:hypothetical protein
MVRMVIATDASNSPILTTLFRLPLMAVTTRLLGALALAAVAACSTDPTSPTNPLATGNDAKVSSSSTNNIVVTESDIAREQEDLPPTRSWVFYYRLVATSTGAFVTGPGNPPLGVGSFEMSTPTAADKGTLFNFDHVGTPIADITAIRYATYRNQPGSGVALPSINIQIDKNGGALLPGDFMTLVYEPYVNNASIQDGVWQTWNTIPGIWWATRPITRPDGSICLPQACTLSWSDIVAAMPNATIVGGFGVNQGSFNGGLIAATDALTIAYDGNTWVYNFEPFRSPSSKDDCKNGGWETVRAADGSSFKNQGQCIKYVNENSGHP